MFKLKGLRSWSRKPLSPYHLKRSFRNSGMPLHWVLCMTGGQADLHYVLSWVMPGSQSFTVYPTDLYFSNCKDHGWNCHDDKVIIHISGPCGLPFLTSTLPFRSVNQGIVICHKIIAVNQWNKKQFWWLGTFIINYVLNCHFPICGYHCERDGIGLVTCSKFHTQCASVLLIVVWNCIIYDTTVDVDKFENFSL